MTAVSSRTEQAIATRQRLLDVAVKEFCEGAFDRISVRKIAQQAGVGHGILFHYFKNKRALYLEAVEVIIAKLFDFQPPDPSLNPRESLVRQLLQMVQRFADNRDLFLGYLRSSKTLFEDPGTAMTIQRYESEIIDWIWSILDLQEHETVRRFLHLTHPSIDGLIADWLERGQPESAECIAEAAAELMIGALGGAQTCAPSDELAAAIKKLAD